MTPRRRASAGVAVLLATLAARPTQAQAPATVDNGATGTTPAAAAGAGDTADAASQQTGTRYRIDGVLGVVGDRVILESEVQRQIVAYTDGQPVSNAQLEQLSQAILREIGKEEIWVQVGKATGRQDPLTFEEQIDARVDAYVEEQKQQSGSYLKLEQQLRATGRSLRAVRDQQRNRILGDYAKAYSLARRFRDREHLLVTPQELERYYQEHRGEYAAVDRADLEAVAFDAGADPAARAAAAAAAWRAAPELSAAEIASRFDGRVPAAITDLDLAADAGGYRPEILAFARGATVGEVSAPIALGRAHQVFRVTARQSRPEQTFADADLQVAIQQELTRRRQAVAESQILDWKLREMTVIPPELRRLLQR